MNIPLAFVADTHFGDINQQLTALKDFYRMADNVGCPFVCHCGDLVEGAGMRKSQAYHTFLHGADEIVDYCVDNYPDRLPTWIIGGNHDESLRKSAGYDVVRAVSRARSDIKYLGMHEAYFRFNGWQVSLFHGQGGRNGLSRLEQFYSRACKKQKSPDLVVCGHMHYFTEVPYIENSKCMGLQVGGFQGKTEYLKRLFKNPVVGGAIVWFDGDIPEVQVVRLKERKNDFGRYKRRY